jgi:hypothetical protein
MPFADGLQLWFLLPWTVFHLSAGVKVGQAPIKLNDSVGAASCVLGTSIIAGSLGSLRSIDLTTCGGRLLLLDPQA